MPHNPNQPRTNDGRFDTVPAAAPQTLPERPTLAIDPNATDSEGITLRQTLSRFGIYLNETHEPIEISISDTAPAGMIARNLADNASTNDAAPENQWARTYHTRFRNFHSQAIEATRELFRARPSQLTQSERETVFENWVNTISDIYGMERPSFHWSAEADYGGGGFYRPSDHSITMSPNHPSVITLIHETRHALQHAGKGAPMISRDFERDARAWSLSLYYKVRPNLLKRLVREGRVFHIDPTVFNEPTTPSNQEQPS